VPPLVVAIVEGVVPGDSHQKFRQGLGRVEVESIDECMRTWGVILGIRCTQIHLPIAQNHCHCTHACACARTRVPHADDREMTRILCIGQVCLGAPKAKEYSTCTRVCAHACVHMLRSVG